MNTFQKLSVGSSLLATLTVPAMASVVVNSPVNNTDVDSTFTLSAIAATCSSENVKAMGYSFDSSADSTVVAGTSIEAPVGSSSGVHTLHVKAWGENGAVCVSDVTVNVKPLSSSGTKIPANADSVSNVQALGHWNAQHDTGGKGSSHGSTRLVSSPSMHGTAREFNTSYSGGGDERYSVSYADDTRSTNFFYDAWVYFTDSGDKIANLEMDSNQAIGDGRVVIFGVQCDGYKGTWDFTENVGSVRHGRPHWQPVAGTKCNPRDWSKKTWHHVQISYSRSDSGDKITYHSVWLDGTESKLNKTANGLFDLGWHPQINTQFQVDGLGSNGSTTVYLDNLTISRW